MGRSFRQAATMALLLVGGAAQAAAPTIDEYVRSQTLRDNWSELTSDVADPGYWVGDTHRYAYRKTVLGGTQWMVIDAKTLEKRPAFDHTRLAAALSKASGERYSAQKLPIARFEYSPDERAVTFGIYFQDGRYRCTLTDYVCTESAGRGGQPRAWGTTRDLKIPADNSPKLSPDGKWEAFVNNYNVVVRAVGDTKLVFLSADGAPGDFYDPESIVWAPDSKKLAAYRVVPGYRREVVRVQSSPPDQFQPKVLTQLYTKAGDPVDIDRPVIFNLATKKQLNIPTAVMPNPYRMSPLAWRKDSATLRFEYDQRGHQVWRVIEADAVTGAPKVIVDESSKTFVNTHSPGRRYSHDVGGLGNEIVWMSERDGWNHLYLFDGKTGKVKTQLTKGNWVVREVVKVDAEKREVIFAASGMRPNEDPYLQHYYRVGLDGRGLKPITTANGYHDLSYSRDGTYYVDNYSRIDAPNVAELRRTGDGTLLATLEKPDISQLVAAGFKAPESFVAKARDGKTDIWGVVVRPRNFDPTKKYPVIENIYAGPHSSFVPKNWIPFGYQSSGDKVVGMQAMADMGFIVVQIDGMGTLNRSKAFHDYSYKKVGEAGFPDRIAWHKAFAAKNPWYDVSRVGIYGGSAGGQNTLLALEYFPDFYKAGVAYAGCFDNRMDKIGWNEAWMGWPLDDSYLESSGTDNAWRLKGQVLLVTGELDMNVDPASTLQVVNALINARKDFDLLIVPNGSHGTLRSSGPIDYGLRRQYDFFVRHLQGEKTPDWNALPITEHKARLVDGQAHASSGSNDIEGDAYARALRERARAMPKN